MMPGMPPPGPPGTFMPPYMQMHYPPGMPPNMYAPPGMGQMPCEFRRSLNSFPCLLIIPFSLYASSAWTLPSATKWCRAPTLYATYTHPITCSSILSPESSTYVHYRFFFQVYLIVCVCSTTRGSLSYDDATTGRGSSSIRRLSSAASANGRSCVIVPPEFRGRKRARREGFNTEYRMEEKIWLSLRIGPRDLCVVVAVAITLLLWIMEYYPV